MFTRKPPVSLRDDNHRHGRVEKELHALGRIEYTTYGLLRPIDDPRRLSVCHAASRIASLCKHDWTDRGPAWGEAQETVY